MFHDYDFSSKISMFCNRSKQICFTIFKINHITVYYPFSDANNNLLVEKEFKGQRLRRSNRNKIRERECRVGVLRNERPRDRINVFVSKAAPVETPSYPLTPLCHLELTSSPFRDRDCYFIRDILPRIFYGYFHLPWIKRNVNID